MVDCYRWLLLLQEVNEKMSKEKCIENYKMEKNKKKHEKICSG